MRLIEGVNLNDKISNKKLRMTTSLPTLNQVIVESTLLEARKAVTYSLPSDDFFVPVSHSSHTRAKSNKMLIVPKLMNKHKEWFAWKAANPTGQTFAFTH